MMRLSTVLVLALAAGLPGCGNGAGDDGGDDVPADFTQLIGRSWTVPAGNFDTYKCTRIQIPEDMYVTAFRSQSPLGSHHSVLTVSRAEGLTMGDYDCGVGTLDLQMLYAAGVGTDDLVLPEGVAVRLIKGQYLNLNLHLFNAGDTDLSGESAVLIKTIPADSVVNMADMVFAGTFDISIPGDGQPHTARGGCDIATDYQMIALWPHMHQYATHQQVNLTRAGTTTPVSLLDDAYAFSNQKFYPQATPVSLHAGDHIEVTCTYVNDGPGTITWGDSSTAEMCFSGMYRYPSGGILFECVSGTGGF